MADQLATASDLASLLQSDLDASTATLVLELATARVQRAAGGQRILDVTDTAVIDIDPWSNDYYLPLPQLPVRSVALVVLDGVTITDWVLRNQKLWRLNGWLTTCSQPSQVKVTSSHGLLAGSQGLQLARSMTLSLARMCYPNPTGVLSEAIDDYKVTYAEADARMQMTPQMEQAIADAYGTSAYVTVSC
jgi:hypothetical protein